MDAVIQVQILKSSNDILEHALKTTHPHAITYANEGTRWRKEAHSWYP
jgi:hypothetical protein